MNEKRFEFYSDDYLVGVLDTVTGKTFNSFEIVDKLNEQQSDLRECRARKRIMAEKLKQYQTIAKRFDCASSQEVENLILSLQDLCGKSDYENAELRIENKELQKKVDWLCEVFDYGSDESIKSSSAKKGKVVR